MQKNFMRHLSQFLLFFLVGYMLSNDSSAQTPSSSSSANEKKSFKVAVIVGSTRPNRIGRQITDWVLEKISTTEGLTFKLVDLRDFSLPLLDEPIPPAHSENYAHDHTKKWSTEIKSYDGYIFVIPEYNAGYPASVKNAIDYLYKEWSGKAAAIISYGFSGGKKSADQFRNVLEFIKLRLTQTMPALTLKQEMFTEDRQLKSPEQDFASYVHSIHQAIKELKALAEKPA